MASAGRASQALGTGLAATVRPRYVCRSCRHQLGHRETQQLRQNSSLSPRQAISRHSNLAKEQRRSITLNPFVARTQPPEEAVPAEDAVPMEPYVEAATWDGLEHMGHQGHWRDLPPDPKDNYKP